MQLTRIIELLSERNIARQDELVGVSQESIAALEAYFGLNFPSAYKEFLSACGRSAGSLAGWSAIYFDDLKEIVEEFDFQRRCVGKDSLIPTNGLLVAQHDNKFDYMVCDGSENSEVFRITFTDDGAFCSRFASDFMQYLEKLIDGINQYSPSVTPFYIDECGEMHSDNLELSIPLCE